MLSPLIILSFFGLINAFVLYLQHSFFVKTGKKFYCLAGEHCEEVVESRFGKTLGVKNEVGGMIYYLSVIILFTLHLTQWLYLFTLVAMIFSLYLLFVQSFILKKFCSWCLIAIAINISLFLLLLRG